MEGLRASNGELMHSIGTPDAVHYVQWNGGKVFADAKLHDIPNTVAAAARALCMNRVDIFNLMCLGGLEMMKAAVAARNEVCSVNGHQTRILGVTILTSHNYDSLVRVGIMNDAQLAVENSEAEAYKGRLIEHKVVQLAALAQEAGLDGVIASPREAAAIRRACGLDFEIVTPGIRSSSDPPDDQKRTMTAADAIRAGASRLVIGRPILKAQDPAAAARRFATEIEEALITLKA